MNLQILQIKILFSQSEIWNKKEYKKIWKVMDIFVANLNSPNSSTK